MSDVEIVHPVPVEEVLGWVASMSTTFLDDPAANRPWAEWRRRDWVPERSWGAYADGRWVATLRTLGTSLTVPGQAEITADGLTNVTVAATHRRAGLLTSMLSASLAEASGRGDAVSILIAAEYPIYGRFGYSPATLGAHYTVHPRRRGARLHSAVASRLRQVDADEMRAVAPAVFDVARTARAGNINRSDDHWNVRLAVNGFPEPLKPTPTFIVHEGAYGVDGYVSWAPTGPAWDETGPYGQITVTELTAATDDAYRGLWQYLLGIDGVDQIHLRARPGDEPLSWLLVDGRSIQQTYRGDHLWLRMLDVPAALSARRYCSAGRVVLEVVDDETGGYASGRYTLDAGPDHAQCTPTDEEPELRLSQRALASAYLGGFSLIGQAIAAPVDELRPGALARTDAMFMTPLAPWCATGF